jgi:hypothetical protein
MVQRAHGHRYNVDFLGMEIAAMPRDLTLHAGRVAARGVCWFPG